MVIHASNRRDIIEDCQARYHAHARLSEGILAVVAAARRRARLPARSAYEDRFALYRPGSTPPAFNVKQFNSNIVMRWEYAPGSTFFLVWQQGRTQDSLNPGSFEFARDYRDLFRAHPANTLLAKVTYWFNP